MQLQCKREKSMCDCLIVCCPAWAMDHGHLYWLQSLLHNTGQMWAVMLLLIQSNLLQNESKMCLQSCGEVNFFSSSWRWKHSKTDELFISEEADIIVDRICSRGLVSLRSEKYFYLTLVDRLCSSHTAAFCLAVNITDPVTYRVVTLTLIWETTKNNSYKTGLIHESLICWKVIVCVLNTGGGAGKYLAGTWRSGTADAQLAHNWTGLSANLLTVGKLVLSFFISLLYMSVSLFLSPSMSHTSST